MTPEVYRNLSSTISASLASRGQLIAGPDCPQVTFSLGLVNPSGALFDFFSSGKNAEGNPATREADEVAAWSKRRGHRRSTTVRIFHHSFGIGPGRTAARILAAAKQSVASEVR